MSSTVILRAKTKENQVDQFVDFIAGLLPETRAFPGCNNIDIFQNESDMREFVFYEDWESISHYERYLAMRSEQGVMNTMVSMLQMPPDIQYLNLVNI